MATFPRTGDKQTIFGKSENLNYYFNKTLIFKYVQCIMTYYIKNGIKCFRTVHYILNRLYRYDIEDKLELI